MIIEQTQLDALRALAAQKKLIVWIDAKARIAGQPFITLKPDHGQHALTLAVFSTCEAAAAWLGVSK